MRLKTFSNRLNQLLVAVLTIAALATGQSAWADNIDISADATDLTLTDGNTYTVTANVEITNRITVTGTVNLVLGAGKTLHAPKGIQVSEDNTLTISGDGALTIDDCSEGYAGIGVKSGTYQNPTQCGDVNIKGGVINVKGGYGASGIGGGANFSTCGNIAITGGQVTVTAGIYFKFYYYAIGAGSAGGSLTIGWTSPDDYIVLTDGCSNTIASISVVDGKEMYVEGGTVVTEGSMLQQQKSMTIRPLTSQQYNSLSTASINGLADEYANTGKPFNVSYLVRDVHGTDLTKGKDYTDATSPTTVKSTGDYTLTVTGTGDYFDSHDPVGFKVSDLIKVDNGQKYIDMGYIAYHPIIYGVVWPSTDLASLKIYDNGGKNGKIKTYSDSYLILTAPEDKVINLEGTIDLSENSNDKVTIYDGCTIDAPQLCYVNHAIKNVRINSTGRMVMIHLKNTGDTGVPDGIDLTATLRSTKDLEMGTITIPVYFNYQDGNAVNVTYTVKDVGGNTLTKGTHYNATIKKVGTTTVLDEVTEVGQYELTITAKDGSGYTGTNSTTFYVCEGLMMTSDMTTLTSGTYSVIEDVTFGSRINVSGDVKLILWKNATITASDGIEVNNDNKLTIEGEGTLSAITNDADEAAIGSSSGTDLRMGTLVINGGTVIANGDYNNSGGIGSFHYQNQIGGSITINGGVVNAYGRRRPSIGWSNGFGTLTINGGKVTASIIGSESNSGRKGTLTLGWTDLTDFIECDSYEGAPKAQFVAGKHLKLDGTSTAANFRNIGGKKLVPMTEAETKNLSFATIRDLQKYYAYTGSPISISYTVEDALGHQLQEGTDYTATITNGGNAVQEVNAKATYTLTINAKTGSDYTGSCQTTFDVKAQGSVYSSMTKMTNNVYSVSSDVTIEKRITITGDVILEIPKYKKLTAMKGFEVSEGNSLTIQGEGKLVIDTYGDANKSGIGASNPGTIIINGATLNIDSYYQACAIGCDYEGHGGTIIINGGEINAERTIGAKDVFINGGQVTAPALGYVNDGTLTLGWTTANDFIKTTVSSRSVISFSEGKPFYVDGTTTEVTLDNIYTDDLMGKKLVPKPNPNNLIFATLNDPPTINWYTGDVIDYTIKDCDGNTLIKDQDYTVSMIRKRASETDSPTELKERGIYALTVNGIGNYIGSNTYKVIISSGQKLYIDGAGNAFGPGYTYMEDEICIIAENEGFATNYGPLDIRGDVMIVLEDGSYFMPRGISIRKGCTLTIDTRGNGTGRIINQDDGIIGVDGEMGTLIINNGGIEVSQGIGKTYEKGGKVVLNLTNINSYVKTKWSSYLASITIPDGVTLYDGTNTYDSQTPMSTFTSLSYSTKLYPIVSKVTLIANQPYSDEEIYWTTSYYGNCGYRIDGNQDACAYTATIFDDNGKNALKMHKLGRVIPIGTPVIIVSGAATINMTVSDDDAETTVGNDLKGTDVRMYSEENSNIYVLSKPEAARPLGFYPFRKGYLPPHKAYLQLPTGSAVHSFEFMFDDDETGIVDVRGEKSESRDDIYYDLNGRRVLNPTKGLYIKNGKKIIK